MLPRLTLISAAAAACLGLAAPAIFAGAADYGLELVEPPQSVGAGAVLTVRLTDLRRGTPVADAVIFATRMDMAPDGMAAMTSPITVLPSGEPGLYRFGTDITMAGNWRFSIAAKVQGEEETVQANLIMQVQP